MSEIAGVRYNYRPPGTLARPGDSITPPAELDAAVRRVVACWNRLIPRRRIRCVNQVRWQDLRAVLADWTAEDLCAGIEFYARQDWQRKHSAWKTFDAFFGSRVVAQWVEQAADAAGPDPDDPDACRRAADVARLRAEVAAKLASDRAARERQARFDRLPTATKNRLLAEANAELLAAAVPPGRITRTMVWQRAIAAAERMEADQR